MHSSDAICRAVYEKVANRPCSDDAALTMEHPAGKRFLTRRRLVAGGVPLLLALAVSVVLWRPQSVLCDLKLECVTFDTSADGDLDYAVLNGPLSVAGNCGGQVESKVEFANVRLS